MERPRLTQREAAAACGVSLSTIRRYREGGRLPHAERDSARGWLIPVEDLLAAGLRVGRPAPPEGEPPTLSGRATPLSTPVGEGEQPTVSDLAAQLTEERHRRQLAEAAAEHLGRELAARDAHLADVRRALLALMPAPETRPAVPERGGEPPALPAQSGGHEHPVSTPVSEGEPPAPRRRWPLRRRT